MIVSHRDRFLKVFLSSLVLFGVSLGGFFWDTSHIFSVTDSTSELELNNIILLHTLVRYLFGPMIVLAEVLYIYSHYLLARAKGYSAWFTLLGLINTFGILILFLLPDRHKNSPI